MWIKPPRYGTLIVRRHPCPSDIISDLVSDTNPGGTLTHSDFDLDSLVLHGYNILELCIESNMDMPRSGLDNKPTVSWRMQEASNTNLVVEDLL